MSNHAPDHSAPAPAPAIAPPLPPVAWGRRVFLPLLVGAACGAALIPFDPAIREAVRSIRFPGDVKRLLLVLQEFGGPGVLLIASCVILLLDRDRFRRVLDWFAALIIAGLIEKTIKIGTGRLRPDEGPEPVWLGPLGRFDFDADGVLAHSLEFWRRDVLDSLSMPSGHTLQATIAACFLAHMYPPLRGLVWPLVAVTAIMRVHVGAHWPSDTVVSVGLGLAIGHLVIDRYWGVRAIDAFWRIAVDRNATARFPAMHAADQVSKERGKSSKAAEPQSSR